MLTSLKTYSLSVIPTVLRILARQNENKGGIAMKAKDYYEKYCGEMIAEAYEPNPESLGKLFIEMFAEVKEICDQRHAVFDRACLSIIDEQNDKWNAIRRLFIKNKAPCIMAEDGFKRLAMDMINRTPGGSNRV